ncbi:Serine/threonine protein kinase [Sinosporangium album]|uniref:non-specific serine/threonine protein kinase n=1 Tax=Sinosporangium album TaxID=504805 RepID=A0A1G7WN59_9ACTN|nr:serine/threonine-protein kinase [Sinosporangium album]SDG72660.1 Serine/threonine protein kinase [Sinosporangium album]
MTQSSGPEVPGYDVLDLLGQGGFGTVYRARQLAVGREVALKIDNRVLASDRDKRRFMREVTAAGALSGHPHVAHVYDAGVLNDGRPYMVMELCPGGSLTDRLRRDGTIGVAETRDIGMKIADALAAAHQAGVLHRDLKPANILVNRYGNVVLSDFGLATMPNPGGEASVTREALTPAYAPPEAFDLTEPTEVGDVYSLAATLYALMLGRPPRFPADGVPNIAMIMALHRLPVPDLSGVPADVTALLRQAMDVDPARRPAGAAALRDALAALPLSASAPAHAPRAATPPQGPEALRGAPPSPRVSAGTGPGGLPPYGGADAKAHSRTAAPHGPGAAAQRWPTAPVASARRPASPSRAYPVAAAFFAAILLTGAGVMVYELVSETTQTVPASPAGG